MAWKNVLVYSEKEDVLLQIMGKGRELADKLGGDLVALLIGSDIEGAGELSAYGANKILVADDPSLEIFSVEPYEAALLKAFGTANSHVVLIGATKRGKELAARVAAALETGCMTECFSLDIDNGGRLIAERLTYGGSTIATEASSKAPHIATVPSR
ncbi:MAG: electron transfer flavoprotein subunit alpha, partial [Candidatus Bathyarchaeota archaeon]